MINQNLNTWLKTLVDVMVLFNYQPDIVAPSTHLQQANQNLSMTVFIVLSAHMNIHTSSRWG